MEQYAGFPCPHFGGAQCAQVLAVADEHGTHWLMCRRLMLEAVREQALAPLLSPQLNSG